MKNESNRFIGTVLEYEAPFETVKNTSATTSTVSKISKSKNESSNERNEKVSYIIIKEIQFRNFLRTQILNNDVK